MRRHLRHGLRIDNEALTAQALDHALSDEAILVNPEVWREAVQAMARTARTLVRAGLHTQLALSELSATEVRLLSAVAREEAESLARYQAALIGIAAGYTDAWRLLSIHTDLGGAEDDEALERSDALAREAAELDLVSHALMVSRGGG